MDYLSLGREVRKRRRAYRLTQEQLAKKVGISLSFLGHIERGTRKASVETVVRLADALETTPNALLAADVRHAHQPPHGAAVNLNTLREGVKRAIADSIVAM